MNDDDRNLADGLLKALKTERDGHSFYMMAANSTQDPKGKKIFETLAGEELDHLNFLKAHYDSIMKTGKLSDKATLGAKADFSKMSPIFSDGIKDRINDAHYEISALSIGIQLELDSLNFYKSQSEQIINPQAKRFYAELAAWESGHYQALLRQQEDLKEDYWSEAGFSPF